VDLGFGVERCMVKGTSLGTAFRPHNLRRVYVCMYVCVCVYVCLSVRAEPRFVHTTCSPRWETSFIEYDKIQWIYFPCPNSMDLSKFNGFIVQIQWIYFPGCPGTPWEMNPLNLDTMINKSDGHKTTLLLGVAGVDMSVETVLDDTLPLLVQGYLAHKKAPPPIGPL